MASVADMSLCLKICVFLLLSITTTSAVGKSRSIPYETDYLKYAAKEYPPSKFVKDPFILSKWPGIGLPKKLQEMFPWYPVDKKLPWDHGRPVISKVVRQEKENKKSIFEEEADDLENDDEDDQDEESDEEAEYDLDFDDNKNHHHQNDHYDPRGRPMYFPIPID